MQQQYSHLLPTIEEYLDQASKEDQDQETDKDNATPISRRGQILAVMLTHICTPIAGLRTSSKILTDRLTLWWWEAIGLGLSFG